LMGVARGTQTGSKRDFKLSLIDAILVLSSYGRERLITRECHAD
jgi:hypothetical protein